MDRSAGKSILSALTWSQRSALECRFPPEFPYALKKRKAPDHAQRSHTRSNARFAKRGIPGHGRGGFGRRQQCRFLSFARDALIARSPFRPAAWSEIAELLKVLINRH